MPNFQGGRVRREFEPFCLLRSETMRKVLRPLSFAFDRIPYKPKKPKNNQKIKLELKQSNFRADCPSDKDSKNINYIGGNA